LKGLRFLFSFLQIECNFVPLSFVLNFVQIVITLALIIISAWNYYYYYFAINTWNCCKITKPIKEIKTLKKYRKEDLHQPRNKKFTLTTCQYAFKRNIMSFTPRFRRCNKKFKHITIYLSRKVICFVL